jgi:OmpA-OmpF porin, OOP family
MTKRLAAATAVSIAGLLATHGVSAQTPAEGLAVEQLDPAPAGDGFFGVPSPFVGGHLVPRALLLFDYAARPLVLVSDLTSNAVISAQGFLHVNASLALWDRLLVSVLLPLAVVQKGDNPTIAGVAFKSPSSAALGDVRLSARVRLYGKDDDPIQIGAGPSFYLPTGSAAAFAGEGAFRMGPQLMLGGRFNHFVWTASLGAIFRASDNASTVTYGVGAAYLFAGDRLQVGPELYAATPLQEGFIRLREDKTISRGMTTNAEALLGVRARVLGGLVLGVAAGPGLSGAVGTPAFRALGSVAWSPLARRPEEEQGSKPLDTDADGLLDSADACPYAFGPRHADPKRSGCPLQDRDEDGVADQDDACPDAAGIRAESPKDNGCPPDRDRDSVPDALDLCPDAPGDQGAHGCPGAVAVKAPAPAAPPAANGDGDSDGIPDAADACPKEKGAANADAATNGCPRWVRVTEGGVAILSPIQFKVLKSDPAPAIDPASEPLLTEVRDVIAQHPEFVKIEVQAHTDDVGKATYNETISTARAESVRKWLVDHGVLPGRLVAKGYGSAKPIADNKTTAGKVKNRRVEFVVLEKK